MTVRFPNILKEEKPSAVWSDSATIIPWEVYQHGTILSRWEYTMEGVRYEITTPVEAEIVIAGESRTVPAGSYLYFG